MPGTGSELGVARNLSPERAARAVQPEEARGLTETYVLKVDENTFTARIVNGSLDVSPLVGRLGSS